MPGLIIINPVKARITDAENNEVKIAQDGTFYSLAARDEEQLDVLRSIDRSLKHLCVLLEGIGK